MLKNIIQGIDAYLWRKGLKAHEPRVLARNQTLLTAGFILLAAGLGWKFPWLCWLAVSAGLATWNFYLLARCIQQLALGTFTKAIVLELLCSFYGRLAVAGGVIVGLTIGFKASPVALLAGFSTPMATVLFWTLSRVTGHNIKEA